MRKRLKIDHPDKRYSRWPDRLCEAGRFGQKTGAGVYRYDAGSRVGQPDPETARLIAQVVAEQGTPQRTVSDEEIVERCLDVFIHTV